MYLINCVRSKIRNFKNLHIFFLLTYVACLHGTKDYAKSGLLQNSVQFTEKYFASVPVQNVQSITAHPNLSPEGTFIVDFVMCKIRNLNYSDSRLS